MNFRRTISLTSLNTYRRFCATLLYVIPITLSRWKHFFPLTATGVGSWVCVLSGKCPCWKELPRPRLLLLLLSRFNRVWLCDPIDGSPPGSPVPGILQARALEWAAISYSNAWKWKGKVKSLSRVWLFATPWTAAHQAPPSMGFSRQECWSGVSVPSPGGLPPEGLNPGLLHCSQTLHHLSHRGSNFQE